MKTSAPLMGKSDVFFGWTQPSGEASPTRHSFCRGQVFGMEGLASKLLKATTSTTSSSFFIWFYMVFYLFLCYILRGCFLSVLAFSDAICGGAKHHAEQGASMFRTPLTALTYTIYKEQIK